jgi:hypothetical protein
MKFSKIMWAPQPYKVFFYPFTILSTNK